MESIWDCKKNLLMENQRKSNIAKKIVIEIGLEFLNLIVGNIYTKTGLSLLFFILGLVCIFANMANEIQKPKGFYIVGGILVLVSIILILIRCSELKQKMKKPNA